MAALFTTVAIEPPNNKGELRMNRQVDDFLDKYFQDRLQLKRPDGTVDFEISVKDMRG